MTRKLPILLFVVALPVATTGCNSCSPSSSPAAASSTNAPIASVAPATKKTVTSEDCAQWADHGVRVAIASFEAAVARCPKEQRDEVVLKLQSDRKELREGAIGICTKHLGREYLAGDGQCFAESKTMRELTACKFAPMTNPDDSDVNAVLEGMRRRCLGPPSSTPPTAAPSARPAIKP